jgi:HEAT repeat protein
MSDRNTKIRLDAANELAKLGSPAISRVKGLLSHQDYTIRRIAAYVLGKIGNPESVEILVDALGDDNPDVRKSAAQALNRIGENAIPLLIRALGNISKDVRASAVWALSKMGDIVIKPLIEVLSSEVKDVRASAVWALSKVGNTAINSLIEKMNDPEKNIRESAIWGLAKIGEPAIQALAKTWNVRIGKEAKDGESEAESVDLDDLLQGGENSIKQWIKFMLERKKEGGSDTPNESEPSIDSTNSNTEGSSEDNSSEPKTDE